MIQNEKKISISVSNLNFSTKAETEKCYSKLVFTPSIVNLEDITSYINQGYALSHLFFNSSNSTFTTRQKKNDNFISSQLIAIDLDNCEYNTLSSLMSDIELVPSICYTTLSHKTVDAEGKNKGNRYRLLYAFNTQITSVAEYRHMYNCVVSYLKQEIPTLEDDTKMVNPAQMFFGSTSTHDVNKEVYNNNVIYSFTDFINYKYVQEYEYESSFKKIETELKIRNGKFMTDFNSKDIGNRTLVERYESEYQFFENTPLPVAAETEKYIILPSDYLELKRYYITDDNGNRTPKKLKDGKHRRRILYTNALLRKIMFPGIEFDHLLYCLMVELTKYYINTNDYITRKQIYSICKSAMETDIEDDKVKEICIEYKVTKKWVINKRYVEANHTTIEYVRNKCIAEINNKLIVENYNPAISVKKNLEIFKENNIDIKKSTLYKYVAKLKGKPEKEKVFKEIKVVTVDFILDSNFKEKNKLSKKYSKILNKWDWDDEDFEIIGNKISISNELLNKHMCAHGAPII